MKYIDSKNSEWMRTTSKDLISNAHEMKQFLPCAERFQSHVIEDPRVQALAASGMCSEVEPTNVSQDLWGYPNLCLHGDGNVAFNNVDPVNGFDAWRQASSPLARVARRSCIECTRAFSQSAHLAEVARCTCGPGQVGGAILRILQVRRPDDTKRLRGAHSHGRASLEHQLGHLHGSQGDQRFTHISRTRSARSFGSWRIRPGRQGAARPT